MIHKPLTQFSHLHRADGLFSSWSEIIFKSFSRVEISFSNSMVLFLLTVFGRTGLAFVISG